MSLITAVLAASEGGHELAPLIAPAPVIAGVMAVLFIAGAAVTFSYRDVTNRLGYHRKAAEARVEKPADEQ
ncbi:hypothetical protein [Ruicaihuangia caeni]|uniref:Uncharacterized protein n=1 Tax=Ruicaihuangia caeni TaxID=3042517 RepID=A0AAW6T427_9MICO|nr:hypothetical protein [Klugiella sp. YN-L-19]MDI2097831.1 hypothetical protein [Klugiella sp. YN-L-19]